MSEQEQAKEFVPGEGPGMVQNGLVRGIPGEQIAVNGVLDLRGVPVEAFAPVKTVVVNGVVLLDEINRGALAKVSTVVNGTITVADASLRLLVQPEVEITKTMVEAMPAGQKLMVVGIVYVHQDVPAAVLAEKIEQLTTVGILIAPEAVHGALFGKLESTGVAIALRDDSGTVVRCVGDNRWDAGYLSHLDDGSAYVNVGNTTIAADLPEELVAQKIAAYYNVGATTGPEAILSLLRSRCSVNMGAFNTPEEAD